MPAASTAPGNAGAGRSRPHAGHGSLTDALAIANQLPKERQTAFFTATMTHNVRTFASQLLNDPATVEVAPQTARHEQIDQMLCYVDDLGHKKRLLKHFLAQEGIKQAIIFTATKRDTEELADELCVEGLRAAALHGDMPQRERTRTLTQLRRGEFDLLVATDVAARGIDVAGISHVFNFDLPRFAEDYVHRALAALAALAPPAPPLPWWAVTT
ncbi:MAG: DEAD/DEAH box helicase [Rivihabitans pingtungensis]